MLILAPMQGLTELLFRRVFHECYPGAFDYAVSPFLSLTHGNLKSALAKVEDVLPEMNEGSMPVVPQILGHEADGFADLANRLYELGYSEVNWNMGCPMRRVAAKHRGSGILPFPDEVRSILDSVVPRLRPSLSVKVRLGYISPDEIDRIIPVLNDYPLKDITIHPRIGKQMYSGRPNIEKLRQIMPAIRHKVVYNGDICSVYDYNHIREQFPMIENVMIGRGALYNPLLPAQIKGMETSVSAAEFIVRLTDAILEMDISRQAKVRKTKEYWCLLSKALPGSEERKRRVLHAADLDKIHDLILQMTK